MILTKFVGKVSIFTAMIKKHGFLTIGGNEFILSDSHKNLSGLKMYIKLTK